MLTFSLSTVLCTSSCVVLLVLVLVLAFAHRVALIDFFRSLMRYYDYPLCPLLPSNLLVTHACMCLMWPWAMPWLEACSYLAHGELVH